MLHTYPATVLEVHDGDTIKVAIQLGRSRAHEQDLGFHIYVENHTLTLHLPIRMLGCNARELHEPGGVEARDNLIALLPAGTRVSLRTVAADKYGTRYDAAVTLPDGSDLVTGLIAGQWAAAWDGSGVKPVPPWPRTIT